jgi:hypothetical protein
MQIKMPFVLRQIAGEYVLVPIASTPRTINGLISLNEVGAFLWERLPDAADADALVDAVVEIYDVDREQAAADVEEFLGRLREIEVL